MNFVLALFVVVGFAATIEYFDLPSSAHAVGQHSKGALAVLRDDAMDDREKEEELQQQSVHLFRLLGALLGGSVLALGLPLAVVWLLEQVGVGAFWGTLSMLERIDFLVGVTIVGGLGYLLVKYMGSSS